MKKVATFALILIMCFNLTSFAVAAEVGETTINDEKGLTYILSNSILGTTSLTFYDELEGGKIRTVTVYLVPKDTVITLPDSKAFYLALWYTPNENVRGGWGSFYGTEFIPAGMTLPFDMPVDKADEPESTTSARESSTLRIWSLESSRSIYIRGVDTSNSSETNTPFKDIPLDAYYLEAVSWALNKNITTGTDANTFSPNKTCTRGEIITFLWRAGDKPVFPVYNVYTDVSSSDYFYEAARWAYLNEIVPPPTFAADTACTRSMTMTYIWKAFGSPEVQNTLHFSDIPNDADYIQAVAWAVKNGITTGTSESTFSPDKICTRAEIMTFLYRTYKAMGVLDFSANAK